MIYWFVIAIVGLLAVIALASLPHNLRVWRARRDFRQLPPEIIERVLDNLQDAASPHDSVTFLRPIHGQTCDDPTVSRVGGLPYAELGDRWPETDSGPDTFLVQVRLDDSSLGSTWQGRLIQVFFVFDLEQTVRSYASPRRAAHVAIRPPRKGAPVTCIPLRHIQLPRQKEPEEGLSWSAQLLENVPQVRETLNPFGKDIEGLLSQILCPEVYGYELTAADEAFVGGEPILIQNPHEPVCDSCGQAMRFLFQFGEIIPDVRLADGGICYIYGCDKHPDHCTGFLDSH